MPGCTEGCNPSDGPRKDSDTYIGGELGVSPSLIFIPFPKRKGNKGMVRMLMNIFRVPNTNFLYKAVYKLVARYVIK